MSKRRLAAIMFTDIVGYTLMMGKNEKLALNILQRNREIHQELIKKYQGKWLKEIGDGILAYFNSASDAVLCANSIQELVKKESISLRIGIHEGEVVFDNKDIYGDGVNIASRIQEIAKPGCTYISDAVNREIKNKPGFKSIFIEESKLKNVEYLIKLYRVEIDSVYDDEINNYSLGKQKLNRHKAIFLIIIILICLTAILFSWFNFENNKNKYITNSIAVLPFKDLSSLGDQKYFGDGIAEEIINQLSKISDLRVAARTSSFVLSNQSLDIKDIGRKLNVNSILEGSVRKHENKIKINIQLIDVNDGFQMLSLSFDRDFENIFEIQNEIAKEITAALNVSITDEELGRIEEVPTKNITAYNIYLIGLEHYNRMSKKDNDIAVQQFKRAIELDPNFAQAHARLGRTYVNGNFRFGYPPNWLDSASAEARIAINLEPKLSAAYGTLGFIHSRRGFYNEAIKYYDQAFDYNPNSFNNLGNAGMCYLYVGNLRKSHEYFINEINISNKHSFSLVRMGILNLYLDNSDSAIYYFDQAIVSQPDLLFAYTWKIKTYILNNRLEEAYNIVDSIYQYYPNNLDLNSLFATINWLNGDFSMAMEQFKKIIEVNPRLRTETTGPNRTILADIYLKLNKDDMAFEILRESYKIDSILYFGGNKKPDIPYNIAAIQNLLGNTVASYEWLVKALDGGFIEHKWMEVDPLFENIRNEKKYLDLIIKIKQKIQNDKSYLLSSN